MGQLKFIPLKKIQTDFQESYPNLVESIKEKGVINPIILEKISENSYIVIDGMKRLSAVIEAGFTKVPCYILED